MASFKSLFSGQRSNLIGLDIGSSSVKLIELSRRGQDYAVEAFAIEPLPADALTDSQINVPELVAPSIARALNRAGTRTREVALAVSGSTVITKQIGMPAGLRPQDLEDQIMAEADQYIPYPVEEVNLDFQVVGQNQQDDATVDVMLAACRKDQVESRVAAVEIAGLKARVVDVELYALENAARLLTSQIPDEGHDQNVALVDVGDNTTSLLVLREQQSIYARDQAFGGKQLTEDMMRQYDMSFEEANRAKQQGDLPDDYAQSILSRFIEDLTQQIDRSMQFFFASPGRHDSVSQVILSGGCARIEGLAEAVEQRLEIPTVIARPFADMKTTRRVRSSQLEQNGASMLIAAGLALRAFDEAE